MSFFKVGAETETLHSRARLNIIVFLSTQKNADFTSIRRQLDISDGQLSQHLAKLQDAGLVHIEKTLVDKKTRTTASLTTAGVQTLSNYVRDVRKLLDQVPKS